MNAAGNNTAIPDRATYLEPSPYAADGGNLIGKLPGSLAVQELQALRHPTSPVKAIRAKCLDCCGGSEAEVRKCIAVNCALWPMRMGANPLHGRSRSTKSEPANLGGM